MQSILSFPWSASQYFINKNKKQKQTKKQKKNKREHRAIAREKYMSGQCPRFMEFSSQVFRMFMMTTNNKNRRTPRRTDWEASTSAACPILTSYSPGVKYVEVITHHHRYTEENTDLSTKVIWQGTKGHRTHQQTRHVDRLRHGLQSFSAAYQIPLGWARKEHNYISGWKMNEKWLLMGFDPAK